MAATSTNTSTSTTFSLATTSPTTPGLTPTTLTTSPITTSPTTTSPTTTSPTTTSSDSTAIPTSSSISPVSGSGQQSTSSAKSSQPSKAPSPNDRLSNGAVAGVVIAVALGLALLTFSATFLFMRRQKHAKGRRRYRSSKDSGGLELSRPRPQDSAPLPKKPLIPDASSASGTYENVLPQSADDRTIQHKVKATLDQFELHVENFYRHSTSSATNPDNVALGPFDSPYLPASLMSLLPRSKNKVNLMKHALAQYVTSSISPGASPARSLLPAEYALLPNTITTARSNVSAKAGSAQIMSRWRVMTAYLRPDPTEDAAYLAQRDKNIDDTVQSWGKAFAPWKNTRHKDEDRARSLAAILEDAANLGIFLFSQPSTLKFHWPSSSEVGPGRIVVSPALIKTTDEKGQDLAEAQVMVNMAVLDA